MTAAVTTPVDAHVETHEAGHAPAPAHDHGSHDHGGHGTGHAAHGHHAPEDRPPSAPLWLLSFADMMTNLLCFFILLSAFSMQQSGLGLEDGLGSMKEEIKVAGKSGNLDGRTVPAQFNAGRVVYRGATPVNTKTLVREDGRMTDGNRDALRRILIDALAKPGRTLLPTPILFDADGAELSAGHEAFLDVLAEGLAGGRARVLLDGYAFEEGGTVRGGWEIAERRARAVADGLSARGLPTTRIEWRGHGVLRMTDPERRADPLPPQERMGRRSVLVTLMD